ncbi:MAG TPA: histidine--tRNA ligase [Rhizomicrobium sp.]|jgi:histidyl-tRNA synthetase|nr:histidine--tRNA ligase [Rhizomicrobium sp.]
MASDKQSRPKARTVRGFRDRAAGELAAERRMLDTIRRTYESYGFDALETPFVEYTDALGKFLPDIDRPNAGVFSFRDDDEQWVSLRYDLTAPLARYVAENQQFLPRPFRRYQIGTVFRNDKPGPGRYREFIQCDADTVGTASPSADAEMVMMFADTLEALGLKRGEYAIKVSSRKILDGLLEAIGVDPTASDGKRGVVLRAIDKLDRLGPNALYQLLTTGRKDESGDFTQGAELLSAQADNVLRFLGYTGKAVAGNRTEYVEETAGRYSPDNLDAGLDWFAGRVQLGPSGQQGLFDLNSIAQLVRGEGYGDGRVHIDPTIVRGLDYYTGAVFEAQLTFPVQNEKGQTVVFGSVGGGGRYDDLVARFTGQKTPAVGFSIGVSRLLTALQMRKAAIAETAPLVVVTVFDKANAAPAFAMVRELRAAKIRAEAYVGTGKLGDQFKYADKRGAALAVIEGSDERARGEVTIKDLALGAELAKSIESRAAWTAERQAQVSVKRADLVAEIAKLLARGH